MGTEFVLHVDLSDLEPEDKKKKAKDKLTDATEINNKAAEENNKLIKAAKVAGTALIAKQTISAAINYGKYRANTIGARYGDTARQNEINNMLNITDKLINIGGSTAAGALVAGPVGAVLGLVSGVIPEILSAIERVDQWNMKQRENDINEVRSSERLGLLSTDRNRGK